MLANCFSRMLRRGVPFLKALGPGGDQTSLPLHPQGARREPAKCRQSACKAPASVAPTVTRMRRLIHHPHKCRFWTFVFLSHVNSVNNHKDATRRGHHSPNCRRFLDPRLLVACQELSTVTTMRRIGVAILVTVVAFGPSSCCHMSTVSTVRETRRVGVAIGVTVADC